MAAPVKDLAMSTIDLLAEYCLLGVPVALNFDYAYPRKIVKGNSFACNTLK